MKIWKLKFNVEEYDSLVPVKYSLDKFQIFDGKKRKLLDSIACKKNGTRNRGRFRRCIWFYGFSGI